MQIIGDEEPVFLVLCVRQRNREVRATLVRLNQHQQFAENLAQIAAIDLVDDEHVARLLISRRFAAELMEDAVASLN